MRIGEYQTLLVERDTPQGLYLVDSEAEVLLPRGLCAPRIHIGDTLEVFVYTDSEDRPVATTKRPYAVVGQFAMLRVVSMTRVGAFLDWGLDKDLFCPVKAQTPNMREGSEVLVRVYLDEASQRVTCTTKLNKFLQQDGDGLSQGQQVKIMVAARAPNLIAVIIDGHIKGSLFPDEWHERLKVGDVRDAYVKNIRAEDRKVAVSLRPQGYRAVLGERERLLSALQDNGGFLPISDRSSPEDIQRHFGLSKATFKKLLGALYKERIIDMDAKGIRLV